MCHRTQWLNVPKEKFLEACKERRIGSERAEKLWGRLNEIAKSTEIARLKAHDEMRDRYRKRDDAA
jgi:hypothetical protein